MDQFVYSDIFETKGLEYIIVIFFLLLIIPVWILISRPLKVKSNLKMQAGILRPDQLRIPPGLLYSKNHTWSHLERNGVAMVGLDDLLLHLTGGVQVGFLQEHGARISKGEVVARIVQDGKKMEITSPISGEIVQVNTSVSENPGTLNEDPYDAWLFKIRPERWQEETNKMYLAGEASQWICGELNKFKDFIAGTYSTNPELVLQEGGELLDFPLSDMTQEVWTGFQKKFLQNE